jgi:hypothetical protein
VKFHNTSDYRNAECVKNQVHANYMMSHVQ